MAKRIITGSEAREQIKIGLDVVADAVKKTLGPRGRNVIIDKGFQAPTITNDGVTCSDNIIVKDSAQRLGAEVGKGVARKTNEAVGDGTTTSLVLTQAIYNGGLKYLNSGINVIALKQGIDKASKYVIAKLKEIAKPIKNDIEIEQIATISAESAEIGKVIADTIKKIGHNGVIAVEDSQTVGITSQVVEGMELSKGFISPAMITNFDKGISEQTNVPVLVTDKKIVMIQDILPLLESIIATGIKELFIIAEDFEGEALATAIINKARGSLNITAIKAPGFGNGKKEILEDIVTLTGGRVILSDAAEDLSKITINDVGMVKRVIVSKEKTVIIGDNKQKEKINARVAALREQLKTVEGKIDRKTLEDRINKLAGGIASIKVGAVTETEQKYLKLKIDDAVAATKAAIEEGVVSGGGGALARISRCKVDHTWLTWLFGYGRRFDLSDIQIGSEEEEIGFKIVMEAILTPLENIVLNAGKSYEEIDRVINTIQWVDGNNVGYNAITDCIEENMIDRGIIDPVKVTRLALENSASAAGTLLTTDVIIAEEELVKSNNN